MSVNELSMEILENRTFYVSDPQLKKTHVLRVLTPEPGKIVFYENSCKLVFVDGTRPSRICSDGPSCRRLENKRTLINFS